MSDETRHDDRPDDWADDWADDRIRALLADLGSGPEGRSLPPEVAARLDDTLARLVAERSTSSADAGASHAVSSSPGQAAGNLTPLPRRWLPRLTAAAAAVIVLGVGGVTAANLGGLGGSSSDSTAGGATSDTGAKSAPESAPDPGTDEAPEVEPAQPQPPNKGVAPGKALGGALDVPQVRAAAFASDVTALLELRDTALTPEERPRTDTGQDESGALRSTSCPGPVITDGAVPTRIRFDGSPAVLVVHRDSSSGRLVEAWDCGGVTRLAGTTLTP